MGSVRARIALTIVPLTVLAVSLTPGVATADNGTSSVALRDAVTVGGIHSHLNALQTIADSNGGTRFAGGPGHLHSAQYVAHRLTEAGYQVRWQNFSYPQFSEAAPPMMAQTSPTSRNYIPDTDFATMDYSASGDVTAILQPVDLLLPPTGGSTSGCEAADFAGLIPGQLALLQRGTCSFAVKALNAQAAGASGAVIFNEGNAPDRLDLLFGTLGSGAGVLIPVVGATFAVGQELATAAAPVTLHLKVTATTEIVNTSNVLADTPTGRSDRLVVVGGHLDSVHEGPGIEDNGTGTATTLEVALKMAQLNIHPRNKVRFAFWSGEEDGLVGSTYYVSQLSPSDIKNHALNLNFDMIGSPNFVRFVYDGDGSATGAAGPNGSAAIERLFTNYFADQGLPVEATAFDGRSDYGPFVDAGIPAGGLFTGAEGIKTAEQAAVYGGSAGVAYDACYHLACDTVANISDTALDQMSDAVAHAVLTFAMTTSAVNGTAQGNGGGASNTMDHLGARFTK